MITSAFNFYHRCIMGPFGDNVEFIVVEGRRGSVVHWIHRSGVDPIATIDSEGKLSLFKRPMLDPSVGPLHIYHSIIHLQMQETLRENRMDNVFDTRHLIGLPPQTIEEAKAALDKMIPAAVAELDFIYLSDEHLLHSPRLTVLNAMFIICSRDHVPKRSYSTECELRTTPVTPIEQSIVDHIANKLFYCEKYALESEVYKELHEYVNVKVEQVLQEMNGALGVVL